MSLELRWIEIRSKFRTTVAITISKCTFALPLASIHNFGLDGSPSNAISEGRPTLQHELGSGSSWYRRDVSRMTRTKNFLRQIFFKVFLKTTFFHDLCHPDHYEPKIFFRFSIWFRFNAVPETWSELLLANWYLYNQCHKITRKLVTYECDPNLQI